MSNRTAGFPPAPASEHPLRRYRAPGGQMLIFIAACLGFALYSGRTLGGAVLAAGAGAGAVASLVVMYRDLYVDSAPALGAPQTENTDVRAICARASEPPQAT